MFGATFQGYHLVLVLLVAAGMTACDTTQPDEILFAEAALDVPLEADFSYTCDGLNCTFVDLSTGTPESWLWECTTLDGVPIADPQRIQDVALTFPEEGEFLVTLTVKRKSDRSVSTLTKTVSVGGTAPPPPPPGDEPPTGDVPGPDTDAPYPIDMGDASADTPGSYKGLPLRLTDTGEPTVTSVDGVIGVVCVGMSNASQECQYFIDHFLPTVLTEVNAEVAVVNCSLGGHAIEKWNDPANDGKLWDKCISNKIPAQGLSADQIRVIYHKAANQFTTVVEGDPNSGVKPAYPDPASDYYAFYDNLTAFSERVAEKFPSVQAVYTTSRSYGGFATKEMRGEPLSYEEGHALNTWLADNAAGVDGVWFGWGPYIWAPDCATGDTNASGVCYDAADYKGDGIHPADGGNLKISTMIHARLLQHGWYRAQ